MLFYIGDTRYTMTCSYSIRMRVSFDLSWLQPKDAQDASIVALIIISLSGYVQHYKRMLQRQSQPAEVKTEARFVLAGSVCQVSPPTHKETVEPFVSLQTGLGLGHPPLMLTREGAPQLTACI